MLYGLNSDLQERSDYAYREEQKLISVVQANPSDKVADRKSLYELGRATGLSEAADLAAWKMKNLDIYTQRSWVRWIGKGRK